MVGALTSPLHVTFRDRAESCYSGPVRPHLLALALLLPACDKPAPDKPSEPRKPAPQATSSSPAGADRTAPARAGGLTWTAPDAFVRKPPKSSMRVAEYSLTGAPQAELGVFYFGADQGGSVDANMARWVGQFTQPDGSPTQSKRSERDVKGIKVSLVEATGTFGGGMSMPGGPAPTIMQDAMLLAAIAKGPEGSVFFKLTGPKAAIEGARAAFDELIASITTAK